MVAAAALDEAAAFNREFPGAVPSEVHVAVVMDLVLVQLRGTAHCGTLGCQSWVVGAGQDGASRTLLNSYTHPSSPPALSRCGETVSFLLVTGPGMQLAWTEWRLRGTSLEEVTLVPEGAVVESPPPCAASRWSPGRGPPIGPPPPA